MSTDIGIVSHLQCCYQCVNAPSDNDERWGLEEDSDYICENYENLDLKPVCAL